MHLAEILMSIRISTEGKGVVKTVNIDDALTMQFLVLFLLEKLLAEIATSDGEHNEALSTGVTLNRG